MRDASLACIAALLAQAALAADVKVTPLGGQEGEFCRQDRALVFEDPNGTRILYDAGRTVAGANDPRLGKLDIVLISHMHGDHLGNAHNAAPNSDSCDKPDTSVSALPNSSSVNIALAKKSKVVTGGEMPPFFANTLRANGGKVGPGSKTETFMKATLVPAHLPLSGRSMSFDADGKCVAGC